ncbi:MAG: hypothetical protein Q9227_007520 [Pyrenula ochraceoflavens]
MFGTRWLTYLESGLNTTFICPVAVGLDKKIPNLQWAATGLDSLLVLILAELSFSCNAQNSAYPRRNSQIWGAVLALNVLDPGVISYVDLDWCDYLQDSARTSRLALAVEFPLPWVGPMAGYFIQSLLRLCKFNAVTNIQEELEPKSRLFGWPNGYVKFVTLAFALGPAFYKTDVASYHPIDMLIFQAGNHSAEYVKYATQGHSLEYAVAQYRRRYTRNPPPGFDKWYKYAIARESLIIDQYDQIYEDMLPFWSVQPAELRRLTMELTSDPWNELGLLSIRNGSVSIGDTVPPTHRWMMEGVTRMIEKFVEFLPDMDLAFNINDEPRIVVPYNDITSMRESARGKENAIGDRSWPVPSLGTWTTPDTSSVDHSYFKLYSLQNNFAAFSSGACPSNSRARNRAVDSNPRSHIDYSNIAPHSLGQFMSDWQLSKSICHQPDMAHLHGLYASPAALKGSRKLLPVFSQSKAHGYNDILYPSCWNYIDKVAYRPAESSENNDNADPPFHKKLNTLFWRGATSEGVSPGTGTWRGMTRQRLVHLANNLTNSAHDEVTLLVQDPYKRSGRYRHVNVLGTQLDSLGLSTDIKIVDHIVRCGGMPPHSDCDDQEAEFTFAKPVDFQNHWKHRYLFDLDGAGFSGRFLPFLQSHSLPFKTALFREWYDERITPWAHFVPLDLRLHGVYSTLAYFAGMDGRDARTGKTLYIGNHLKEAEAIAENGRNWANKALRKEDMEIYFFRLLLEWGRVLDDQREELGYSGMIKNT